MKKSILLFIFLIYTSLISFSQNLQINYIIENNFEIRSPYEELLKKYPEEKTQRLIEAQAKASSIAKQSTYTLEIAGIYSYFYLKSQLENEAYDKNILKLAQLMSNIGTFYQDVSSKKVIEKIDSNNTLIAHDFSFYKWQLFDETKEILGYTCYKATVYYEDQHPMKDEIILRNITVWFAPQLAAGFGPEGFGGLPGLILKKCHKGKCLVATEIKEHKSQINLPKGKLLTREQFQKKLKNTSLGF